MKLDILFHYNVDEVTGEITFIGKEEVAGDTAQTSKRQAVKAPKVDNGEPVITLDSNKLILTSGVVQMMNICSDCRIDIKYKKHGTKSVPIIGTDAAFGTNGGNKLTKNNTISYRGAANAKLAKYGTTFKIEPSEDEGIFYLIGDKMDLNAPDDVINIEDELDIEALDDLEIEDSTNLEDFDFTI